MTRLQLSKSSLSREQKGLKTYQKFLPSLDLKRQELMRQRAEAQKILLQTETDLKQCLLSTADEIPMLSNDRVDLQELVKVTGVKLDQENIMGASLPVLTDVEIKIRNYSFLAKPQWVDGVAKKLEYLLTLRIRVQVEQRRLELLNSAVKTITQRVNLFDKVLIPRAQKNIKRIKIHLSDAERASVVIAKLAKNKRLAEVGT
jgi:V/A-type H+-transporting ATPase subunit D